MFHLGTTADARSTRRGVTLDERRRLDADLVVVGIGVRPASRSPSRPGSRIDRGVTVDEFLRDERAGRLRRGRHRALARPAQRRARPRRALGRRRASGADRRRATSSASASRCTLVPFFWSQHYDVSIDYVGHAEQWDAIAVDGSLAKQDGARQRTSIGAASSPWRRWDAISRTCARSSSSSSADEAPHAYARRCLGGRGPRRSRGVRSDRGEPGRDAGPDAPGNVDSGVAAPDAAVAGTRRSPTRQSRTRRSGRWTRPTAPCLRTPPRTRTPDREPRSATAAASSPLRRGPTGSPSPVTSTESTAPIWEWQNTYASRRPSPIARRARWSTATARAPGPPTCPPSPMRTGSGAGTRRPRASSRIWRLPYSRSRSCSGPIRSGSSYIAADDYAEVIVNGATAG